MQDKLSRTFFFLLLAAGLFSLYYFINNKVSVTSHPTLDISIPSKDKKFALSFPKGWAVTTGLNSKAELEATDNANDYYLIVLTDLKKDFVNMHLPQYSEETRKVLIESLQNVTQNGPHFFNVGADKAIAYDIHGVFDPYKVSYLHVIVESPKRYYQVLAWTGQDAFPKAKPILENIAKTLIVGSIL